MLGRCLHLPPLLPSQLQYLQILLWLFITKSRNVFCKPAICLKKIIQKNPNKIKFPHAARCILHYQTLTLSSLYMHPCLCSFHSVPAKAVKINQLGLHSSFHALPWLSTFLGHWATVSVLIVSQFTRYPCHLCFSINLSPIFLLFMVPRMSYGLLPVSC